MERLNKHGKSLKNFTYTDKETADDIYSAINSTQFLGVSVSIMMYMILDATPFYIALLAIANTTSLSVYGIQINVNV
jgi:hypothetical protein